MTGIGPCICKEIFYTGSRLEKRIRERGRKLLWTIKKVRGFRNSPRGVVVKARCWKSKWRNWFLRMQRGFFLFRSSWKKKIRKVKK